MKKTNKILALSAITAMSVAMAACDDSSGSSSPIDTCKASCKNATTAISCDANGNEVEQDCAKENKVCDASFKCVAKGEAQTCVEMCNGSHELVTCDSNGKPHTENCGEAGCHQVGGKPQCGGKEPGGEDTDPKCTDADNKCDGNTLYTCKDGKIEQKDCAADGKVCDKNAKKCDVAKCTDADNKCDGDTLYTCDGVNLVPQNCAASGMICNQETKACEVEKCKADSVTCDGSWLITCVKGQPATKENCALQGMVCKENQCVKPDAVYKIGDPCTCTGASCNKTLTGKEIKEMVAGLSALVGGFNIDFNLIKDDDTITFPDFFSKDIQGCQGIVAPEGMTIGCFRDSNITVTSQDGTKDYNGSGLKAFVDSLEKNEQFGDKLKPYASKLHKILPNGVAFSSTNGYCLAATIDIKAKGLVAAALANDVLSALVSLVNTGDHSKAKLGTVVCPEGGVKFDYEIAKTVNKGLYGLDLNVGFDMCLKSCETDADCRQNEGYTCVDIPNGVPAENETQQVQKACFDKDNLDYFKNLTNQFNGTTEETPKT